MSNEIVYFWTLNEIISCIDNGDWQLLNQFSLTVPHNYTLMHIHEYPRDSLTTLSALMLNDKRYINHLLKI